MGTKTLTIAAALLLSFGGAALAQTPAGGGSTEGNMNNPGSVKSDSEKAMERPGSTGSTMAPRSGDVPSNATPGAPAGSNSGNAATGSGAAPSGR